MDPFPSLSRLAPISTNIPRYHTHRARLIEADIRMLVWRHDGGVRLCFRDYWSTKDRKYTWNGKTLAPHVGTYESYLHDVAHWLVATPNTRALPEFGLGVDPYRESDAEKYCVFSESELTKIEESVCATQAVLALALDLSVQAVCHEVGTDKPTTRSVAALRKHHPQALPPGGWNYVLERCRVL